MSPVRHQLALTLAELSKESERDFIERPKVQVGAALAGQSLFFSRQVFSQRMQEDSGRQVGGENG